MSTSAFSGFPLLRVTMSRCSPAASSHFLLERCSLEKLSLHQTVPESTSSVPPLSTSCTPSKLGGFLRIFSTSRTSLILILSSNVFYLLLEQRGGIYIPHKSVVHIMVD